MELDDLPNVLDVCKGLMASQPEHWPGLTKTIHHLAKDPAYVLGLTINLPADPDVSLMHNLPVPDFDETGFFGRRAQINRIKKLIKGAYPVVSILGDGGIGKSAIALKVAYEILDDPDQKFEAIVWVTAKATMLTTNEIRRINGAIEDSLGLFAHAARELGGTGEADPVAEVLEYLENFKILLIIDNLETVLDKRLRTFLLDLPLGSKVILTSRIGVGSTENPVSLEPLTSEEATQLLHALAKVRDIRTLKTLAAPDMRNVVEAMGGRPAYIRWFVAGIQAGRRPEELLSGNDLLLDFCMSNVHKFLGDKAKSVLQCMQVLPGARSHAELAFLTEYTADETQSALLELLTTNFIQMRTHSRSQALESSYELTEFGRDYLDKRHPVTTQERRRFADKSKDLLAQGTSLQAANAASPYDASTVEVRDSGDFGSARLLKEAINSALKNEYDRALGLCHEAQRLSPAYPEAWRIEGFIHSLSGDLSSGRMAYDRAHDLAPDSATINYFFGVFLLDESIDTVEGLKYLLNAARIDGERPEIFYQIAWAYFRHGQFDLAIESARRSASMHVSHGPSSTTLAMRAYVHSLRKLINEGVVSKAMEVLEGATEYSGEVDLELIAGEVLDRFLQLSALASDLSTYVIDKYHVDKCYQFKGLIDGRIRASDPANVGRRIGVVKSVLKDKFFGFIILDGVDYFFHVKDLSVPTHWDYLQPRGLAAFLPDANARRGPKAEDVAWID